jgi:hypothetical protein
MSREVNEDPTAPKDGSVINVQFRNGTTTKARWNTGTERWEAPDSTGRWRVMNFHYPSDRFERWWPECEPPAGR